MRARSSRAGGRSQVIFIAKNCIAFSAIPNSASLVLHFLKRIVWSKQFPGVHVHRSFQEMEDPVVLSRLRQPIGPYRWIRYYFESYN
jgi:hypothetical protein